VREAFFDFLTNIGSMLILLAIIGDRTKTISEFYLQLNKPVPIEVEKLTEEISCLIMVIPLIIYLCELFFSN
jgi:hypothetical protein